MNKTSKLLAAVLALLLLSGLAACGRVPPTQDIPASTPVPETSSAPKAVPEPEAAPEPEATPESAATPEQVAEPVPAYDSTAYEAAVQALLDEYRIVSITEPGEFREEDHPEIPWYSVSTYLLYQYDGLHLYCGRYDFDGNGVPELVMAVGSEDDPRPQPIGIYAFDGRDLIYLCKEQFLGERASVSVSGDGIFTVCGSGSAFSGGVIVYRIAPDGYSTEILDWYEYEYQQDGSVEITVYAGDMTAEDFDTERLFQPFEAPVAYELVQ